jgi:diaminopimelate decarboxylase
MASNYNTRGKPAEVLVDGDRYALVTERERYEHLTSPEILEPEWRTD